METVLKAKWLTPKEHVFSKEDANGGKTVKLEVMSSGFPRLEKIGNPESHHEQYHLNLRK